MTVFRQSPSTSLNRIQDNILARGERRLLTWLCARMPKWVTPDLLTVLGLIGAVVTFVGYVLSGYQDEWLLLAIAGYVVQWFGDSMDGSLARFRKIERPSYGYFIDHSCDGVTVLLIAAGIGLSPFVTMDIALLALTGYLLMSIHAFLSARVVGELRLSYLAAGPTELRFVLIGLTIAMMSVRKITTVFETYTWFDLFVGLTAGVLMALFVVQTLKTGKALSLAERRR